MTRISIVKRVVKDLNLDEKLYSPTGIHTAISNAKNNLILPDEFPGAAPTATRSSSACTSATRHCCATATRWILTTCCCGRCVCWMTIPMLRERYGRRFEHVLVDEFQDTNLAQYELLSHLPPAAPQPVRGGR